MAFDRSAMMLTRPWPTGIDVQGEDVSHANQISAVPKKWVFVLEVPSGVSLDHTDEGANSARESKIPARPEGVTA